MSRYKPLPPIEVLREYYRYDPLSGILAWNKSPSMMKKIGQPVGRASCKSKGYVLTALFGVTYMAHRIIWALQTGEDPLNSVIDHKDGNPNNNVWGNLRLASIAQNAHNAPRKTGSSGIRNVQFRPGRSALRPWLVSISHRGRQKEFGSYETPEEADRVAHEARELLRGEFSHHGIKPLAADEEPLFS